MNSTFLKKALLIAAPAVFVSVLSTAAVAAPEFDWAPSDGWASQSGGTQGGALASAANIVTVTDRTGLLAQLAKGTVSKIIKFSGTIDMTGGVPFADHADQKARGLISIPSYTTLIGVGANAKITNGFISVKAATNVIVRNFTMQNPCDVTPIWDPTDGATGNWNSEFDGLTIDASNHVWVDHMVFTDAPKTDDMLPIENGKTKQCHDGALDVKNASDYVTVSYTKFDLHNKNNLIGHSDTNTMDDGHLTVTFHHNMWTNITERAPRVRFGKVHLYNNYFVGSKTHPVYPNQYSVGPAYKAKIISANNVFAITGTSTCTNVIKNPSTSASGAFVDTGSTLNGASLTSCGFSSSVGWTVPYTVTLLATGSVAASVTANAGVGHI